MWWTINTVGKSELMANYEQCLIPWNGFDWLHNQNMEEAKQRFNHCNAELKKFLNIALHTGQITFNNDVLTTALYWGDMASVTAECTMSDFIKMINWSSTDNVEAAVETYLTTESWKIRYIENVLKSYGIKVSKPATHPAEKPWTNRRPWYADEKKNSA